MRALFLRLRQGWHAWRLVGLHRWHARLRRIDRETIVAAICAIETNPVRRLAAFHVFTEQPGQAHWQCPCAGEDRVEVRRVVQEPAE